MSQLKVLLIVVLCVVAVAAGGAAIFLTVKKPNMRPPSQAKIVATPEKLARGEYLVRHVVDCLTCHSDHDYSRFACPIKPGAEGMGGFTFTKDFDVPGRVAAQNITPDMETGLGSWTDGEIMRAVREGVRKDGTALFPMMPYPEFREMSDEDLEAIVAYLRTLPPVKNTVPSRELDFPVNLIVKFMPRPLSGPVSAPPRSDSVAYGRYLANIAGCRGCHTPRSDKGEPLMDQAFTGGWEMNGPWGRVVTANLTPAKSTFVGTATKEAFIGRFRAYQNMTVETAPIAPRGQNTIMPWLSFSGMSDEDLGAIYDYLHTLPPTEKAVNKFPDAAK